MKRTDYHHAMNGRLKPAAAILTLLSLHGVVRHDHDHESVDYESEDVPVDCQSGRSFDGTQCRGVEQMK